MKRFFGLALVAGMGLGLALWSPGCGKPSGSSDDRFELTVARSELPADGVSKTAITAIVLDADGTPTKEGVTVVLESTGGTIEPAAVAVAAGLASSSLTSDLEPGLVIVSAHTEPEGLFAEAQVRFTEASAAGLTLTCTPNVLEANGTSEAQCTAVVLLGDQTPVANGTTVTFSTTAGTLSGSSGTTSNGRVTVTLRSTTNGATAIVTATSGSASNSEQVLFQENPPGRVEVRASRSEIQANGTDQTTITATVFASRGGFVNDATPVNCTTSAGTLTPSAPTTTDGVATTTLTSASFETTAEVVCTAGNKVGRTRVKFVGTNTGEVANVRVTANPGTIRVGGQTSTITVRVENASGDGVADETVFLSVSGALGTTLSVSEAESDDNGRVTLTLRSGAGSGVATVTAEAGSQEGTATVTIQPGQPNDFLPFTVPGTIVAGSNGEVNMMVVDSFRNPVADGTIVQFSIVCPGGSSGDGCDGVTLSDSSKPTSNGNVSVTIRTTPETSEAMVRFTASAGSISKTADVRIERSPTPTPTPPPTSTPVNTATPTVTPTPP